MGVWTPGLPNPQSPIPNPEPGIHHADAPPVPAMVSRGVMCVAAICFAVSADAQTGAPITWTNLVNVTVTGDVLQKAGGCDGCPDAGAASQEQLNSDGYIEFTVGEAGTLWMAGLSHGNDDTSYADIDFGFRFNGAGAV